VIIIGSSIVCIDDSDSVVPNDNDSLLLLLSLLVSSCIVDDICVFGAVVEENGIDGKIFDRSNFHVHRRVLKAV